MNRNYSDDIIQHAETSDPMSAKLTKRLKPKHIKYMQDVLEGMSALNEYEMNRSWATLPSEKKLDDKESRIAIELIFKYCLYVHQREQELST